MALFKCKMCGGNLEVTEEMTVCECEYCGTKQTVPKTRDDVMSNLFNRANNLRIKCEFDKAQEIYDKIVASDPSESEAYWGIVLCKYGIEYVEDPATYKKVPTCHRTQLESVMTDVDFLAAVEHADVVQRSVYEEEARAIDKLQKDILEIVHKEQPFDVFICYKETDESGKRTNDSVIANDIYHQLTTEGFKVFYAAITLEDKLGQEYEPYIFAALNSAKVMLVIGSKPEYFNAVWVKNEWSRYMKLMKSDRSKLLIPCYKDMDAYDLPEDFSHLQAQDMSKIGFINDVIRGIKKVIVKDEPVAKAAPVQSVVATPASANVENLLKRGMLSLEDGKWDEADKFFEQVLNENVEEPRAYFGKLLSAIRARSEEHLLQSAQTKYSPLTDNDHYKKAMRFAGEEYKSYLLDLNTKYVYSSGMNIFNSASKKEEFLAAKAIFDKLPDYQPAKEKSAKCEKRIEQIHNDEKESQYQTALSILTSDSSTEDELNNAISRFRQISGWKDSEKRITECQTRNEEIRRENERRRIELKQKAESQRLLAEKKAKKRKIFHAAIFAAVALVAVFLVILFNVIIPGQKYDSIVSLMNEGKYTEAITNLYKCSGYSNFRDLLIECLNSFPSSTIAGGDRHTIGLKSDGTVVATGDNEYGQCDVSDWKDIVAVSAGDYHTVGLKADGTVVATGDNEYGQCDVSDWKDIVAVSAGDNLTVGLKADGTVVATEKSGCDVSYWKDIVAVSAEFKNTVGLKADGTVVATGIKAYEQCDVFDWKDIVAVSVEYNHTVGLKADGTVVATGLNIYGQCDVSDWKDIVAVSTEWDHTVGLKADGTVVATGNNVCGECDVSDWKDIVAVSAGFGHTVGLKADGTVVATGYNEYGQCNVSDWRNIKTTNG